MSAEALRKEDAKMGLFEQITVNVETGEYSYPKLEGFDLDVEHVYRSVERFLPHCGGNVEMAVRLAIHEQLAARTLTNGRRRGTSTR